MSFNKTQTILKKCANISDFGNGMGPAAMPVGIAVGLLGIGLLACVYPLYHRALKKEREKIAPEILRLTDELMKE